MTSSSLAEKRLCLLNLPTEIVVQIIDLLYDLALDEADDLMEKRTQRGKRTNQIILGKLRHYFTISTQDDEPLLNSLQSFSVVNRAIYSLCCQYLWKTISFPTPLPIEIDLWTEEILPKHGSHVKSLSIHLSESCLMSSSKLSTQILYDNVIRCPNDCDIPKPEEFESRICKLSPISVLQILSQCVNVDTITIYFPNSPKPYQAQHAQNLETLLIPSLKRLHQLRNLNLSTSSDFSYREQISSRIVSHLPLLESFSFVGKPTRLRSFPSIPTDPVMLSLDLSRLPNLRELDLSLSHFVDSRWVQHSWSNRLTDLSLVLCENISTFDVQKFVNFFASTLTSLSLAVGLRHLIGLSQANNNNHNINIMNNNDNMNNIDPVDQDEEEEQDQFWDEDDESDFSDPEDISYTPDWNSSQRFNLPELTRLVLLDAKPFNLINGFQESKKLNCLLCCQPDWESIQSLVLQKTWPNLTLLGFRTHQALFKHRPLIDFKMIKSPSFLEFCEKNRIQLVVQEDSKL
ncbi:hypothetical protein DFH28DRAFT_982242 [Melampsora americana]|nr:hypothetical protein DFH28DRAFT_982242 [Melampsora americana]